MYRKIDVAKMNWIAEFSRFAKFILTSQYPDTRINADTQRKSPSSMNKSEVFLKSSTFAVAGASQDRSKYGNKVFRAKILFPHGWHSIPRGLKPTYLKEHGYEVINPALDDK